VAFNNSSFDCLVLGERPYKCNICGNRFTTKGNLKVHFQRHLEQYPNARMNPDPVPEYLDNQPATHQLPPQSSANAAFDRQFQTLVGGPPASSMTGQQPPISGSDKNTVPLIATPTRHQFQSESIPKSSSDVTAAQQSTAAVKLETTPSSAAMFDRVEIKSQSTPATTPASSGSGIDAHRPPHPQPSPLSALSSMSSALATSFPAHQMLRGGAGGGFPATIPVPAAMPPSLMPVAAPPTVNSPAMAAAYSSPFRPQAAGTVGTAGGLPLPPLKPDLDDDDALEQYMEIQQTDTSKIEELVREATAAAAASGGGDGKNPEGVTADPNECVLCHRVLSCRSALQMHYRTHTGERPYRCRLCGRTFTTKGNLKTHMTVHRTRNPGFGAAAMIGGTGAHRCPVCRRDFTGSLALQQHMRAAHSSSASGTIAGPGTSPGTTPGPAMVTAMSAMGAGGPIPNAGPLALPFPGALPAQPGAASGGANAAAMAAAAAMMMMPGLNPLLPFINFPFYPTAGALGVPPNHQPGAQMFAPPSNAGSHQPLKQSQNQQRAGDGSDSVELDLRKSVGGEDVAREKRQASSRDDGENAEVPGLRIDAKRTKMDDGYAAADLSSRDGRKERERATVTSDRVTDDDAEQDDVDDELENDEEPMNHEDENVHGFDYRTSMNRTADFSHDDDSSRDTRIDRDYGRKEEAARHSAGRLDDGDGMTRGKYAAPLLALEERLNAFAHGGAQQLDEKMREMNRQHATDEDAEDWESGGDNEDSENNDDFGDNMEDVDGDAENLRRHQRYGGGNSDGADGQHNVVDARVFDFGSCSDDKTRMPQLTEDYDRQNLTSGGAEPRFPVVDQASRGPVIARHLTGNVMQHHISEGFDTSRSSDSRGSCSPNSPDGASVGVGAVHSESRGSSIASNSSSGFGATPPDSALRQQQQLTSGGTPSKASTNLPHHQQARQQPPHVGSSSSSSARFVCSVCSKPFASASALEIHSRTHSGDRPFVCQVCSKAFTTKGNLKVHMGTHAWNRCPSRRGRRMSVVDPATAAVAAAAVAASSTNSASALTVAGLNVAAQVPPSAVDFFAAAAAAAAAAASNPFNRFVPDASGSTRPVSVFGYAPPLSTAGGGNPLVGPSPPAGGFFADGRHQLPGFGGGFGSPAVADDEKAVKGAAAESAWIQGGPRDERNNNISINNNGANRKSQTSSSLPVGSIPNGFSATSFSPPGHRAAVSGCGELDLSTGRSGQFAGNTSSAGRSPASSSSSSTSSKDATSSDLTPSRGHRAAVASGNGNVITGGNWTAAAGDHRGPPSLTAVMSNCG
jgi:DNA-directed RNA polymerase subunit RPC12/RpoP